MEGPESEGGSEPAEPWELGMEVEEAVAQAGLEWVPTVGEEGKPAYSPVREILKGTVRARSRPTICPR